MIFRRPFFHIKITYKKFVSSLVGSIDHILRCFSMILLYRIEQYRGNVTSSWITLYSAHREIPSVFHSIHCPCHCFTNQAKKVAVTCTGKRRPMKTRYWKFARVVRYLAYLRFIVDLLFARFFHGITLQARLYIFLLDKKFGLIDL